MIHDMNFFCKSYTLDRIIIIGVFQSRKSIKLKSSSRVQNDAKDMTFKSLNKQINL